MTDKKSLIGRGKNVSVRRLQLSGLSRPSGPGPTGNLAMSARPWKKLPIIADWESYKKKPTDIVLIKDLELHASSLDKLRHRLRDANDEDLEQLVQLSLRILNDKAPLVARLKELIADRKATIGPLLDAALAPVVEWARDLLAAIGPPNEAAAYCARFVAACKNDDAAEVMLALVEIGFPAEDYAHLLATGRTIEANPSGSGLAIVQAFARGFAHAVAPAEAAYIPAAMRSVLDARAGQAYIIGVVAGFELEKESKDPLVPHVKRMIDQLAKKLT